MRQMTADYGLCWGQLMPLLATPHHSDLYLQCLQVTFSSNSANKVMEFQ